ncbi:hypothetical protein [Kitasatospora sp. NPDC093679]|uniref:hypothetical protein n=1 Tax=Kitasatospora sp. NPDC093679 TaxID=3154983 RepID=UPI00343B7FFB
MGLAAEPGEPPVELLGARRPGNTDAMYSLGVLLAELLDPPDADGARHWYEQAAEAGDTDAMRNLGILLEKLDPPDQLG